MTEPNTRGEVTINLDATYVMRPSYEAIEAIETATGRGVVALVNLAAQGELSLKNAAIIVTECIRAWGKQQAANGNDQPEARSATGARPEKVARLIHEHGLVQATERCAIVLMAAATGGVTASGEWKPATEKATLAAG
jgi:hypothetical protein